MIKKLFKKPLLHHGLVFYAGKISQMCIRSSSGFHGLIFQKESKQTNDRGIFHSSPAQEKMKNTANTGPPRCIVVLHLSFYLYNLGCPQCYQNSQTKQNRDQTKLNVPNNN